jgi:hypothetical protein
MDESSFLRFTTTLYSTCTRRRNTHTNFVLTFGTVNLITERRFRARMLARTLLYVFLVTRTFFAGFFRINTYWTTRVRVRVHVRVKVVLYCFDRIISRAKSF